MTTASEEAPEVFTEPIEPDAGLDPDRLEKGNVLPNTHEDRTSSVNSVSKQKLTPGWKRYGKAVGSLILDQWFLVGLGILIIIASQVQVPESQQHIKQTVAEYLCVSIIFFITGCTLPTKVLLQNASRWKLHIFVQVQCFLVCSAVIFAVVSLCALNRNFMDAPLLVGMIFAGCVPTTIASNVMMTRQAHGTPTPSLELHV